MTSRNWSVTQSLALVLSLSSLAVAQHHHGAQAETQPQQQSMPGMQMPQPQQGQEQMPGMQMQQPQPAQSKPSAAQVPPAGEQVPLTAPPAPLPPLGASQMTPGPKMRLEELEAIALQSNPTLRQAEAEIRAARGREQQAGLWPNPSAGYSGEEIRGGRSNGGQQGFFVEQSIVLGGKLGAGQRVFQQDTRVAQTEADEQKLRVLNAIRIGFYQMLATQEMLASERYLAKLAEQNLATTQRLENLGQMDETEVLQATIERDRSDLAVVREENRLRSTWSSLVATIGKPELPLATVEGDLEHGFPQLEEAQIIAAFLKQSPASRIAAIGVARGEAELSRARKLSVPDLRLRAGLQQNRELLEGTRRQIGLQGFAEAGIDLPIFNRNQGNVAAARADLERSQEEQRRVELILRQRATAVFRTYSDAQVTVDRYHNRILPSAKRAYELMLDRWGQMAASYPQVLLAQRTYFQAQADYIAGLEDLWTRSIALQGFLLTDGLEAPTRPSEIDQPVRELNLPTTMGGSSR